MDTLLLDQLNLILQWIVLFWDKIHSLPTKSVHTRRTSAASTCVLAGIREFALVTCSKEGRRAGALYKGPWLLSLPMPCEWQRLVFNAHPESPRAGADCSMEVGVPPAEAGKEQESGLRPGCHLAVTIHPFEVLFP